LIKFISENQKDWDRISLYLFSYRSSKHTTGRTPAKIYFAQNLRLPTDLLRGNPSKRGGWFSGRLLRKSKNEVGEIEGV